jgi:hypothetical protein
MFNLAGVNTQHSDRYIYNSYIYGPDFSLQEVMLHLFFEP